MTTNEPTPQPESQPTPPAQPSRGAKVLSGVGTGISMVGRVMIVLYALFLIAVGIVIFSAAPSGWWVGVLVILYALYLLIPGGNKFVIY